MGVSICIIRDQFGRRLTKACQARAPGDLLGRIRETMVHPVIPGVPATRSATFLPDLEFD
jgi:hypothetical protein